MSLAARLRADFVSVGTVAVFAALFAAGCGTRPYQSLTEDAEPLRTQFNADAGRVRVMMLVAPT